jgi:Putative phage abortive infection protein
MAGGYLMKSPTPSTRLPILIFACLIAGFVYYFAAAKAGYWPFDNLPISERGQFGDSFGIFSSLFSALGFGGVLFTLWYQHLTLEKTNRRAELQQFESTLFQMLSTHSSILADIDIQSHEGGTVICRGRDCFHRYYNRALKPNYKRQKRDNPKGRELDLALKAYETMWQRHHLNLGHYFRFIYNVFRYIEESEIDREAKKRYSRIVRAQLSDYELLLLFYNCLYRHGVTRFKPLAEKYALFNNLQVERLLDESHSDFYEKAAFEWSENDT